MDPITAWPSASPQVVGTQDKERTDASHYLPNKMQTPQLSFQAMHGLAPDTLLS